MNNKNYIVLITALVITFVIFGFGILLTYTLDYFRINEILSKINQHEFSVEGYVLQEDFFRTIESNDCVGLQKRITDLKWEISQVGTDLTHYSAKTLFKKKDFDYLKRKYFLLQIKFYLLLKKLNEQCNSNYLPIFFFYEIDQDDSLTQGYILEDVSKSFGARVSVLSFDKDYSDEPLIKILINKYNVTRAPFIIINNITYDRLVYTGEINATILKMLK